MTNFVNFFIVGTPKAGTTSLHHYLSSHPQVSMSLIKETNFFSYQNIKEQNLFYNEEHIKNIQHFHSLFVKDKSIKIYGEASVSYLFYKDVAKKIFDYNPDSKIVIVLRDPVERCKSHYLMDCRLGLVNMDIANIIKESGSLFYQQYVSLGLYSTQIENYINVFGSENVKVWLFEDILHNQNLILQELCEFLEISPSFEYSTKKLNTYLNPKNKLIANLYKKRKLRKFLSKLLGSNKNKIINLFFNKNKSEVFSSEIIQKLKVFYEEDIKKTALLINRDLSNWLN